VVGGYWPKGMRLGGQWVNCNTTDDHMQRLTPKKGHTHAATQLPTTLYYCELPAVVQVLFDSSDPRYFIGRLRVHRTSAWTQAVAECGEDGVPRLALCGSTRRGW
jgi:hypothetical protein